MKKLLSFCIFLFTLICYSQIANAQLYTLFGPSSGIMKGDPTTPQTSSAVASDVAGLFSCGGSSSLFLRGDGTCVTPAGTGVSSITVPAPLTATGCTGGACSITWTGAQTANRVLATPDGSTGAVSLRALASGDLPPINLNSTANGGVASASILLGTNGGTSNGFFSVTGPATSLKTFTFPNASATVLTTNAAVTVAQGGTSLATLTANGVMLGEGTSSPNFVVMGADTVLRGTASADPVATSVPNCGSTTTALSYSTSTHTFGCQSLSSGGTPGGSNTQIQYNNSGVFGGASNFTFNNSTGGLILSAPSSGVGLVISAASSTIGLQVNGVNQEFRGSNVGATSVEYLQFSDSAGTRQAYIGKAVSGNAATVVESDGGDIRLLPVNSTGNVTVSYDGVTFNPIQIEMTASFSTNGTTCSLANNVGITGCSRTSTGVYTMTAARAPNNCVANTTWQSGSATIPIAFITVSGTTITLNTATGTGSTNTAADLTFGGIHIVCE